MLGIHHNLSNEDYHAHKESISRSAIMDFDRSPYQYWANHIYEGRPVREQTPQMLFGEAFHTLIIEPDKFDERFIVKRKAEKLPKVGLLRDLGRPEYDKQKAARDIVSAQNKAMEELFEIQSEGKKILDVDDFGRLMEMKAKLLNHDKAARLIEDAVYESSYFWIDQDSGLMCKARPDILHENVIVDLKTCRDASPRGFQNAMVAGGYHIQGAMIMDGIRAIENRIVPNVINIAIETEYPYSIGVYIIDEFAIEQGQVKYKQILLDLKNAQAENLYPDFDVQTISLPKWAL